MKTKKEEVVFMVVMIIILLGLSIVSAASRIEVYDFSGNNSGFGREKVNYSLFNAENFTGTRIDLTGNMTLGEKITFALGEIIDNIVNGYIRITGGLNVTGDLIVGDNVLFVNATLGRVGIGLNNPTEELHIKGSGLQYLRIQSTNSEAGIEFQSDPATAWDIFTDIDGLLHFWETSDVMVIENGTGNVGIGTSSPSEKLEVDGSLMLGDNQSIRFKDTVDIISDPINAGTGFLVLNETAGGGNAGFYSANNMEIGADAGVDLLGSYFPFMVFDVNGNINIFPGTSGNGTDGNLTISENGGNDFFVNNALDRIGINTSTPQNTLNVVGDGNFTGNLYGILGWTNLTNYPSTCTASQYISSLGDTLTCAAISILSSQISDFSASIEGLFNSTSWNRSGTNVFLANSGDKVGIGTDSPSELLDVDGNATVNRLILDRGVQSSYIEKGAVQSKGMSFYTVGVARITIEEEGDVGIGTTSPAEKLEVVGNVLIDTAFGNLTIKGTDVDSILLNSSHNLILSGEEIELEDSTGEIMRITGGLVGIGTSGPSSQLHVSINDANNDTVTNVLTVEHQTTGTAGVGLGTAIEFRGERVGGTVQSRTGRIISILRQNSPVTDDFWDMAFETRDNDAFVEGIRIKSDGKVGIGTTTPQNLLNVLGDINFTGLIYGNGSQLIGITGSQVSDDGTFLLATGDIATGNYTFDTDTFFIDSSSNRVGIGTTSPAEALDLSDGNLITTATITAGTFVANTLLQIAGTMEHIGDVDTEMVFGDDQITLTAGNIPFISIIQDAQNILVLNENSFDVDFRIESNPNTHAFFLRGSDGNTGIGTSSPSSLLDIGVEGGGTQTLSISGSDATGSSEGGELRLFTADDFDTTYNFYRLDAFEDDFRIGRAGQTDLTLKSGGNFGIGTTNPLATLGVESSGTNSQAIIIGASASGDRFLVATDASDDGYLFIRDSSAVAQVSFRTDSNPSYIAGGGNFGIGTTTPQNTLNVVGDLNITGNTFLNLNWTSLQNFPVSCPAGTFITQLDDSVTCTAPTANDVDPGDFPAGNYSFGTNVLFIDDTNNRVGIGTSSPITFLNVEMSNSQTDWFSGASVNLVFTNTDDTAGNLAGIAFYHGTDTVTDRGAGIFAKFTDHTAGSEDVELRFITKVSGTLSTRMTINDAGNVGIGTTSPTQKLEVNGNVNITDTLILNPQLSPTTSAEGGVFYNSSLQTLMVYNGTQWDGLSGVPEGAIMGFESSCPTGWTETAESLISEKEFADAWVSFNGDTGSCTSGTTCTIFDSFNVDNVTRESANGEYTIYWDRDFANTNYTAIPGIGIATHPGDQNTYIESDDILVGSVGVFTATGGLGFNYPMVNVIAFGNTSSTLIYCQKVGQDSLVSNSFWGKIGSILSPQDSSLSVLIENFLNVTHKILAVNLTLTGNPSGTPEKDTLYAKSLPKAWVNWDGTSCSGTSGSCGTAVCTIRDSFNVECVDRTSTGEYDIYWDRDFANSNYIVIGTSKNDGSVSMNLVIDLGSSINESRAQVLLTNDGTGTPRNGPLGQVIAFGEQ